MSSSWNRRNNAEEGEIGEEEGEITSPTSGHIGAPPPRGVPPPPFRRGGGIPPFIQRSRSTSNVNTDHHGGSSGGFRSRGGGGGGSFFRGRGRGRGHPSRSQSWSSGGSLASPSSMRKATSSFGSGRSEGNSMGHAAPGSAAAGADGLPPHVGGPPDHSYYGRSDGNRGFGDSSSSDMPPGSAVAGPPPLPHPPFGRTESLGRSRPQDPSPDRPVSGGPPPRPPYGRNDSFGRHAGSGNRLPPPDVLERQRSASDMMSTGGSTQPHPSGLERQRSASDMMMSSAPTNSSTSLPPAKDTFGRQPPPPSGTLPPPPPINLPKPPPPRKTPRMSSYSSLADAPPTTVPPSTAAAASGAALPPPPPPTLPLQRASSSSSIDLPSFPRSSPSQADRRKNLAFHQHQHHHSPRRAHSSGSRFPPPPPPPPFHDAQHAPPPPMTSSELLARGPPVRSEWDEARGRAFLSEMATTARWQEEPAVPLATIEETPLQQQHVPTAEPVATTVLSSSGAATTSTQSLPPEPPETNKATTHLTCASLGEPDLVSRAEKVVERLHSLIPSASSGTPRRLPDKKLLLNALATIEIRTKKVKKELKATKQELETARIEEAEEQKLEQERLQRESEARALEEQKRKRQALVRREEAKAKRQQELQEALLDKQRKFDQEEQSIKAAVAENIRKQTSQERVRCESEMQEQIQAATDMFDKDIQKGMDELELARQQASQESKTKLAKVAAAAERKSKQLEKKKQQRKHQRRQAKSLPPELSHEQDRTKPDFCGVVSSIYAENRRRAAESHMESLSFIPYTPEPPEQRVVSNDSSAKSNEEWSNLARKVTGLADALYTEPSENPCFEQHNRTHALIEPLIMEYVRDKNRKLRQRWEELGEEYIVRNQAFSQTEHVHTKEKASGSKGLIARHSILGTAATGTPASEASGSGGRSSSNPYRRARRGNVGASSGGDVVRSEYEQEQIIAELTAKEAMEKRIAHGGCKLPRQICQVEKDLTATYVKTFTGQWIEDPMEEAEKQRITSVWTDMEKCVFLDRFLMHPKDFRKIASFLRNKTPRQCVEFYYNSKQATPYKGALKEHIMRRKRKGDYATWDASIQAALSVGAVITAGPSEEKPLIFSLPESDCSYRTRHFHPMSRDVFDAINVSELEVDDESVSKTKQGKSKKRSASTLFSLDAKHRKFLKSSTQDSIPAVSTSKSEEYDMDQEEEKTGATDFNVTPVRKAPQKWTTQEKKLFVETVEKHGKNWSKLSAAIGTKSIAQIKNYYYDHKKQFAKHRSGSNKATDNKGTGNAGSDALATVAAERTFSEENTPEPSELDQPATAAASEDCQRSALSSEEMMNQDSLHGSDVASSTASDIWSQTQQALLAQQQQQQQLAAQLSSQEARRLLQNQTHQQLLTNVANILPWVSAAQVAALQQQQTQSDHITHATVRDWVDATTQMQNALAMSHASHSYVDPSSHMHSMALAGLAAMNPSMLAGNASMTSMDGVGTNLDADQLQSVGMGLLGYSNSAASGSASAAAAALGLLAHGMQNSENTEDQSSRDVTASDHWGPNNEHNNNNAAGQN